MDVVMVGELDLTISIKRELTVRICVPIPAEMSFGTTTDAFFSEVIWAAAAGFEAAELEFRLCGRKLKLQSELLKLL